MGSSDHLFEVVGLCVRSERTQMLSSWFTVLDLYLGKLMPNGAKEWINQLTEIISKNSESESESTSIYILQQVRHSIIHKNGVAQKTEEKILEDVSFDFRKGDEIAFDNRNLTILVKFSVRAIETLFKSGDLNIK